MVLMKRTKVRNAVPYGTLGSPAGQGCPHAGADKLKLISMKRVAESGIHSERLGLCGDSQYFIFNQLLEITYETSRKDHVILKSVGKSKSSYLEA